MEFYSQNKSAMVDYAFLINNTIYNVNCNTQLPSIIIIIKVGRTMPIITLIKYDK